MNNNIESITKKETDYSTHLRSDFSEVWKNLKNCTERGISVCNDSGECWEYSSYADMYKKAGRLAGILRQCGISAGDQVMICSKTTPSVLSLLTALFWVGAVPVPVPPKDYLTDNTGFEHHIKNILPFFSFYICDENEKDEITSLSAHTEKPLTLISFSELEEKESLFSGSIPEHLCVKEDDVALIQYTSASSRNPKGLLLSYKNLFTGIYDMFDRLEVNPKTLKAANCLPLYSHIGLIGYFLGSLIMQSKLFLLSPLSVEKEPFKFLSHLSEKGIEITTLPNSALDVMVKEYDMNKTYYFNLHTLKWLGLGMEPVKVDTIQQIEKLLGNHGLNRGVVSPCYGTAEATLGVSLSSPFMGYEIMTIDGRDYASTGQKCENMEIKIKKKANKQYGCILIKGDSVAANALIDGKVTYILDKDGYYNTRDIGMFVNDTTVLMGREDDIFVFNGESFFCQEIEDIITECRSYGKLRAVCFPALMKKSTGFTSELIIMYDINRLIHTCKEEFEEEIRKQIIRNTGIRVLRMIHVPRMRIPLTPSGKIMRREMRKLYVEQES
ncbi:MAG: AMP-binding protein [Spirochaetales bacterium]|nr:AMP-binding protein [Spirochaetales bacterium]